MSSGYLEWIRLFYFRVSAALTYMQWFMANANIASGCKARVGNVCLLHVLKRQDRNLKDLFPPLLILSNWPQLPPKSFLGSEK